jgi:Mannosyl-glycoprotein endo-beta-N-acetylglucosaminidase
MLGNEYGEPMLPLWDKNRTYYNKYRTKIQAQAHRLLQTDIEAYNFIMELRRLCLGFGYNFPALFTQVWHETAGFTSDLWKENRNPAGLKTADSKGYQKYYNGVDAARAFMVHMSAYANTPDVVAKFAIYRYLDARYRTALSANVGKTYRYMTDLNKRWAEDPQYGQKIEAKMKELLGA